MTTSMTTAEEVIPLATSEEVISLYKEDTTTATTEEQEVYVEDAIEAYAEQLALAHEKATKIVTSSTLPEVEPPTKEYLSKNIKKAIAGLVQFETKRKADAISAAKASKAKKNLLEADEEEGSVEGETVYLSISLRKIPEKPSLKPHRLTLPNPFRSSTGSDNLSVCLITKDPQEEYEQSISSLNLPCITKVMSLTTLRNEYKPFEAKRQLARSYDLFLADNRIIAFLPSLLGKKMLQAKKQPTVVDLLAADVKTELQSAIEATLLFLSSGPCSIVKIGLAGQGAAALTENALAVIDQVVEKIPGGWAGVRMLHMKTNQSLALPIYHN